MKVKIRKTRNDQRMPQISEQQLNEVDLGNLAQMMSQYSVPEAVMLTQTIAAYSLAALAIAIPYVKDMINTSPEKSEQEEKIDKILQDAGMPLLKSGAYDKKPDKAIEDARKELEKIKAAREKAKK